MVEKEALPVSAHDSTPDVDSFSYSFITLFLNTYLSAYRRQSSSNSMLSKQIIAVARGKGFLNARSIHGATASAMSKGWYVTRSRYLPLPKPSIGKRPVEISGGPNSTRRIFCRVSSYTISLCSEIYRRIMQRRPSRCLRWRNLSRREL